MHENNNNSHQGDWGGPMTCKVVGKMSVLAGIASTFFQNCDTDKPIIYTRISHFKKFIMSNSYSNSTSKCHHLSFDKRLIFVVAMRVVWMVMSG